MFIIVFIDICKMKKQIEEAKKEGIEHFENIYGKKPVSLQSSGKILSDTLDKALFSLQKFHEEDKQDKLFEKFALITQIIGCVFLLATLLLLYL